MVHFGNSLNESPKHRSLLRRPHFATSLPLMYTMCGGDRTTPNNCHGRQQLCNLWFSCLWWSVFNLHYIAHATDVCPDSVTWRWAQAVLAEAPDGETDSVPPPVDDPSPAAAASSARIVITSTRSLSVSIRARVLSLFFLFVAFFSSFITLVRSAFNRCCSNFIRRIFSLRLVRFATTGAAAAVAVAPALTAAAAPAVGSAAPAAASPSSADATVGSATNSSDMALALKCG